MALDLFKLLGTIEVDNSKANQSLDETSNKGAQTQSKLSTAFGAIGKGAAVVGKAVVTGLAVGGAAMAGLTAKALNMSGELEQNMGGSEAVFKEYAGKMQETARQAFSNMGLSTSDYLATANKMGALFQGAGFDIEESMNLSSDAMQRAADVASIMGIDTGAAMEAIAGAAKGNFTMMDNLGVAMNDTTLQAYALEKGINKTTAEMTNQEKIGLAMEMFMEKTAYAAGNYAKENETLAGSLGTAKSALTNFLDGSGDVESLVSSFENLAKVAVESLNEILPRLTSGLTEIVKQVMPMLPPLLQSLLPSIVEGAVGLIGGLVSALPSLVSTLTNSALPQLLSGVMTIFVSLASALPQVTQTLVSALPVALQQICSALPALIPQLVGGLVSMIVILCSNFSQILQPLISYLPQILISVVSTLLENLPILLSGIGQLVVGICRAIPQLLSALWQAITSLASDFAQNLFGKIEGWIRKLFPKSADTVLKILKTIKDYFSTLVKNIGSILSVVVSVISTPFKLAWSGVKLVWDNCVAFFRLIWNNIKSIFSVVDSVLAGDFRGAWNGIKQIWSNCVGFFKNIISNIKNAFSNVAEILTAPFRKGRDAIKQIVDNIKGFFSGLKLRFPNIPLPHFTVSPSGWKIGDLLKGSIPRLGISWYAKAMENPIVMTKPTIWGFDPKTGNLQGGGEAGTEVVSGANTLMNMIQTAVAAQNDTLVHYLEMLIEMLADYFPESLEAMRSPTSFDPRGLARAMAVPMNHELGKLTAQKGRGR